MKKTICAILMGCFWAVAEPTLAQEKSADDTYSGGAQIDDFVKMMVEKHDYSESELRDWLSRTYRQQAILDAISRPAEKTKTWAQYRKIFLTDWRIERGLEFWTQHQSVLEKVSQDTGVPAEMIVAIIGVETGYGRYTGRYAVMDALATLAFDYPPRQAFFRKELEQLLLLVRENQIDPMVLKGSYAGAMGLGQFMPSSYRHYAADYEGDGLADIWNNPADAIASVANYFVRHGWQRGGEVVVKAKPIESLDETLFVRSLKPSQTAASVATQGLLATEEIAPDEKVRAMELQAATGKEYWLALHNFYVITRYNHSELYAMAVYQLGQAIEKSRGEHDSPQ